MKMLSQPTFTVAASFALLQIFKLLSLLITNRVVENILVIPFQLAAFLLPAYFYLGYNCGEEDDPLKGLRLRMPRVWQIPLILSALLLLICGNVLISLVFAGAGSLENGFTLYNTFVSGRMGGFFSVLFMILAYAVLPAVCEEMVYRVLLCRELEKYNVVVGIVLSSVFFAMLHFDIRLFPVYLFSGLLLALTMYATGSSLASVIVHMAFNLFGLFGQPYLNAFYSITGGTDGLFVFILCMLTILAAALFCGSAAKCYAVRSRRSNIPSRRLLPKIDRLTQMLGRLLLCHTSIIAFLIYIAAVAIEAIV